MARVGAVRHPWRTFRDSRPRRLRGGVRLSIFGIGTCLLVATVGAGALAAPLLLAGEGGATRRVRVRRFAAPGAAAPCSYPCAVSSEERRVGTDFFLSFCTRCFLSLLNKSIISFFL